MSNPQSPAVRRSERVPALNPDATETVLSAERRESPTAPTAPIPEDQRPGHHPDHEQDKPDGDAFAERLGMGPDHGGPWTVPWNALLIGAIAAGTAVGVVRAVRTHRDRKR